MLNPDYDSIPTEEGGTGSGTPTGEGGNTTTTGSGSGTTTGNSGGSWNTSISNFANKIFNSAAESGQLKLEIDPAKPLTANTRYNETTGKIEVLVNGKWVPVTVVLVNNTQKIDLSKFSQEEIYSYLQSGQPFPKSPLKAVAPKAAVANTEAEPKKKKWWVWALVAVGVGSVLFAVWKLARKRSQRQPPLTINR